MPIRGRSQRLALLLTVPVLVATACGGGDDGAQGGTQGSDSGNESEAAAATGGEMSFYIGEPEHMAPPSNITENNGNGAATVNE